MTLRDGWQRDGFVIVRRLYHPDEVWTVLDEAASLFTRNDLISPRNLRCRFQVNVRTGEKEFETFDPVFDISPAARALGTDPRLLNVLRALYEDEPCLFKDKLIFKPPGVQGYGLHQDWVAWPGFPRSFLTVLIPLDPADEANGCTIVYPGYHHRCLSVEDGEYHELPGDLVEESRAVPLCLAPGDVALFDGFTPHRSTPNRSDRWRRQLFVSFNKQSDGGEQRAAHYAEFHRRLRARYALTGQTDLYFE